MFVTRLCRCLGALCIAAVAQGVPAAAQNNVDANFTIGAGVSLSPDYFGSDESSFGPGGDFRIDYLRLPFGIEYGSSRAVGFVEGFGPGGSARYIPSRKASDNPELRGLDNVDAALELGFGLGYEAQFWRAYGDVRYGFIGHEAFVGEFGADAILRPRDDLIVNFGPRASWGEQKFLDTYFGVGEGEAVSSGLREYDTSSGFYSVGVELGARYSFSDNWGVEGRANYERLIGDAADSPITGLGTENQFGMQVLITRSITLGF